jgi:hypothetical protein
MILSHRVLSSWFIGSLFGISLAAADDVPVASAPPAEQEMATVQLVLFFERHERDMEEPIPERQVERLANNEQFYLDNLVRGDVALLAGPVEGDDEQVKRVAVLQAESAEEAAAVLAEMHSMQSGKLYTESYAWRVPKAVLHKPGSTQERTSCHLALLRRPAGASSYSTEDLARLQREHLAHVESMAAQEEVVVSGAIENGLDLREALIFRTSDAPRIRW